MKIEFLYFDGCANHKPALNLLKKILKEKGIEPPVEMIRIESDEMAEKLKFPGSPTIRINGQDIDNTPETESDKGYGQKCRVYDDDGILKGIPPERLIKRAISRVGNKMVRKEARSPGNPNQI